jgi:hypothetical protein
MTVTKGPVPGNVKRSQWRPGLEKICDLTELCYEFG